MDFILFDVLIAGNYQPRSLVTEIAHAFGVRRVPVVGVGTLEEAVAYVKTHPNSQLGDLPMEGIVCRPAFELQDRCGNRMIVKIKWKDFKGVTA